MSRKKPYCSAYFFYRNELTKLLEMDFESAVLNSYYQMIQEGFF